MRFSEIADFFREFKYIEKSAVLGIGGDGRKNGFGSILFESPEEAESAALALDQATIGTRYVELSTITYGDYLSFNGPAGGSGSAAAGGFSGNTVQLSRFVNDENMDKCLMMRGLPYRITIEEVVAFFDGFGKLTEEAIHVEEFNGKRSGSALVIMESQDVAQDALASLNKKEIGADGRYVDLFDCNDQFMRKICKLPME